MSTKKLLIIYTVIVVCGVAAVLKFGLSPRPVDKIKLSEFADGHVIVNSIFMSIRQEMKETPILILGIDPNNSLHTETLLEFIEHNQEEGMKYQAIVMDQNIMPPAGVVTENFSILQEKDRFLSGIQTALEKKIRLLIVVSNLQASPLLPDGVSAFLKTKYKEDFFSTFSSLTLSNFPRDRSQESSLSIPCRTGDEDLGQTAKLGCLILQKSRSYYRKKMTAHSIIGFMIQVGSTDFVLSLTTEN